ncbi:hypothetical protein AB0G04_10135 [Actinoplanes sp. NPDC023801]|uniref:hypothetical protein n=1 Tax=Actinoplanes sp. NPDC023801 TaxID=3154595 RepID=UPI0033FA7ABD
MAEWTDDLTVPLPPGCTPADVVDLLVQVAGRPSAGDEAVRVLGVRYAIASDDAEFLYDRFCGGLVRAATGNPLNCPPADKDPVAWESFQRGITDPYLVGRGHPGLAPG